VLVGVHVETRRRDDGEEEEEEEDSRGSRGTSLAAVIHPEEPLALRTRRRGRSSTAGLPI